MAFYQASFELKNFWESVNEAEDTSLPWTSKGCKGEILFGVFH